MNGKTELTAALAAFINAALVFVNATGLVHLSPELIGGINGFITPFMVIFLANRVSRTEAAVKDAAIDSKIAAVESKKTNVEVANAANRI